MKKDDEEGSDVDFSKLWTQELKGYQGPSNLSTLAEMLSAYRQPTAGKAPSFPSPSLPKNRLKDCAKQCFNHSEEQQLIATEVNGAKCWIKPLLQFGQQINRHVHRTFRN